MTGRGRRAHRHGQVQVVAMDGKKKHKSSRDFNLKFEFTYNYLSYLHTIFICLSNSNSLILMPPKKLPPKIGTCPTNAETHPGADPAMQKRKRRMKTEMEAD